MSNRYIEIDGIACPEPDLSKWSEWYDTADRVIKKTELHFGRVSTVFLGLDHNFDSEGPPLLYVTLVFGGRHDGYMDRYSTRAEAEAGHDAMVNKMKVQ